MSKIMLLKAKIYQYTGTYLAQKEEDEYMSRPETIERIKYSSDYDESLDEETIEGIEVGSWQAEHGFCSRIGPYRYQAVVAKLKKQHIRRLFWNILDRIYIFSVQLVSDLKYLLLKLRGK